MESPSLSLSSRGSDESSSSNPFGGELHMVDNLNGSDVFFKEADGTDAYWATSYHTRFSDSVVLRDGYSGQVLLACFPADWRRRQWHVCAANSERVVRVHFVPGKEPGDAPYTMQVLAAHRQQVRMSAEVPLEGGRLAMRQPAGRSAAGPAVMRGSMRSGPLKAFPAHLTPAEQPSTPCGSCHVRLHPRADPALAACLLSLLKWRLDADALRAAIKASKKEKQAKSSAGLRGLLKLRSNGGNGGAGGRQPSSEPAAQEVEAEEAGVAPSAAPTPQPIE